VIPCTSTADLTHRLLEEGLGRPGLPRWLRRWLRRLQLGGPDIARIHERIDRPGRGLPGASR
jgi:hypothetical protein